MSTPTPARLGPYELIASIGKGGMGEVWRARDPRLGRFLIHVPVNQNATAVPITVVKNWEAGLKK